MPARPAFFLNLSVDQQAIAALGAEIAELKRRKVDSEQPLQQLNEELAAVTSSLRSITAQDVRSWCRDVHGSRLLMIQTEIEGVITETRQELKAHDKAKTELGQSDTWSVYRRSRLIVQSSHRKNSKG